MNIEEAKSILSAYRPDGQDADDPQFQEALELTKQDPDWARWFAEAQAWDTRVTATLRQAASPPTELRSALLAQRKIIRPFPWWRRPARVATAAAACVSLLLLIGALFVTPSPDRPFAQYREAMADFVEVRLDRLDLESQDVQTLQQWLAENQAPADFTLPAGLHGRPALGCRLVEWNGHKVSLLCFELENRRMTAAGGQGLLPRHA
ncbi:MAG: hypothetical protein KJ072_18380 [Verrucomicrobia bacterium]|nr:hypothetical protein [Verrucomicrobiota bacterium]